MVHFPDSLAKNHHCLTSPVVPGKPSLSSHLIGTRPMLSWGVAGFSKAIITKYLHSVTVPMVDDRQSKQ